MLCYNVVALFLLFVGVSKMQQRSLLLAAASFSVLASAAVAQEAQSNRRAPEVQALTVTADPLLRSHADVISNVAILAGDELVQRRQSTLGETLNGLPGVTSDPFGGGASRPVIRGQTAPRVRALSDGAALLDASEVSPDHAITGDPLLLEGVEILRGPSALIYGGGAIGGAVNLLDTKIPTRIPEAGLHGVAEGRLGTADNERSAVLGVTLGAGPLAFRLEGVSRRTSDYDVPRYRPPAHDHDEAAGEEDHAAPEAFDTLAGSFSKSRSFTAGVSWIGDRGYLGAAYTEQTSDYGLPGHTHEYEDCHPHGSSLHCGGHDHAEGEHDHDHGHDHDEIPVVDLLSRRLDLRGEINDPFAGIERIRLRGAVTDYRHYEIEDGVTGTTFSNEGYDLRVEAQHKPIGGLRGVVGVQASRSDFAAVGREGFIPRSLMESQALFVLETLDVGDWRLEGALRQEWQKTRVPGATNLTRWPKREHQPFSASLGASWQFNPGYSISVTAARSQRAPSVQELYARGVHLATNTYEMGGSQMDVETALSLELALRKTEGRTTFSAAAYRYDYDGYIFANTVDQFEDFRLIQYTQRDAVFTGFEAEATHRFTSAWSATVFSDYVRAKLSDGGGNLPRIAPARLGARINGAQGDWSGSLEYVRVFKQDEIAAFERETPGYDMVNATLAYDLPLSTENQIYVRATNLLDETALSHTSFLSTLAPQRGRNFVLGVRTRF